MMRWLTLFLTMALATAALLAPRPRSAAQEKDRPLDVLVRVLSTSDDAELQRDVLRGMSDSLQGRRNLTPPRGWSAVYRKLSASKDAEVRQRVLALSVLFGDPDAMKTLLQTAGDAKASASEREQALGALLDRRAEGVPALLRKLLEDDAMRRSALRGLARYEDADIPALILGRYSKFAPPEKTDAIATLTSRPGYALALLGAMEKKQVPTADLSSFQARQVLALADKKVSDRLNAIWGTVRGADKEKDAQLARYKKVASESALKKANRSAGRAVWAERCAQCHVLFGEGGKIGPDLTGSQRSNPEYILHKVLDPNAVVPRDYQVTRIVTGAGRVLLGLIKQESDKVVLLQTQTEEIRVAVKDIEERQRLNMSMMPEGLLKELSDPQVRDLLAYLAGSGQVALPPGAKKK